MSFFTKISPAMKKWISIGLIVLTFLTMLFAWSFSREMKSSGLGGMGGLLASSMGMNERQAARFFRILSNGITPGNLSFMMRVSETGFLWRLIYGLIVLATFLSLLHTLIWHLMDRKYNGFGTGIGLVLILVIFFIFNAQVNDGLGSLGLTFRITAWPFLALIFLAGAVFMWILYSKETVINDRPIDLKNIDFKNISGTAVAKGKEGIGSVKSFVGGIDFGGKADWNCPGCGADIEKKYDFCSNCGTHRPEPQKCPYCNGVMDDNATFCGKCGKQYVPPVVCPGCGNKVPGDTAFCGNCGSKITVNS